MNCIIQLLIVDVMYYSMKFVIMLELDILIGVGRLIMV